MVGRWRRDVKVPVRLRVALFRTLLELNDSSVGAARFCLRGDLVVLRSLRPEDGGLRVARFRASLVTEPDVIG